MDHDEPTRHLELTVHAAPLAGKEGTGLDMAARTARGRLKMFAILLLCASPVIASYVTYYFIRPDARSNYGELIDPQITVPNVLAKTVDGQTQNLQTLKGQWLLISVAGGQCGSECQNRLYFQRQLREGLGKEKDRLDWVWLVSDDTPIAPSLSSALKGATILRLNEAQIAQWLQPEKTQQLADHLYLVDPIGNWMMRFKPSLDVETASKIKSDLSRLMRASSFWDKDGR